MEGIEAILSSRHLGLFWLVWKNPRLKHPSDWMHHIAVKCLSKMKDLHKSQLANMNWKGDKAIEKVAGEMKGRVARKSERTT